MGDNRWLKNSFVYLIILVAALALFFNYFNNQQNAPDEKAITEVIALAKEGKGNKKDKKQKAAAQSQAPAPAAEKPKRGPLKRALEEAEKAIAKLTRERTELETKLASAATWSGPPTAAAELQKQKLRLERELAHAEHEWLTAQEALEAA